MAARSENMETIIFIFSLLSPDQISLVESSSGQHEKGPRTEMIQGRPEWPPSFHLQLHSQLKQQVLLLFQMTH